MKDSKDFLVELVAENKVAELPEPDNRMSRLIFSFPKYFLDDKTNYYPLSKEKVGLIHIAAYYDSLETLLYLERTLKINVLTTTQTNYNVLHYACSGNAIEVAEYILQKFPNLAKVETQTDFQYIYLAEEGNSPEILKLLFKKGASLKGPGTLANHPITQSIKHKNVKCLEILLKNTSHSKENAEYNALMLAIKYNQASAIPLLLDAGIDPAERTPTNETALFLNCFWMRDVNTTRLLCNRLVDIDIPANIKDKAAVHWLCMSKSPEIAAIMLEKNIDVNRFDKDGQLGPFYLVDAGVSDDVIIQILEMLYEHGFQIDLRYSEKHNTILGHFVQAMDIQHKVIKWLISKGANPAYVLQSSKENLLRSSQIRSIWDNYNIPTKD